MPRDQTPERKKEKERERGDRYRITVARRKGADAEPLRWSRRPRFAPLQRSPGCDARGAVQGPDMEKGQPNEETESRRRSTRPLRRADEHHHREARGGSAPVEEALGSQE